MERALSRFTKGFRFYMGERPQNVFGPSRFHESMIVCKASAGKEKSGFKAVPLAEPDLRVFRGLFPITVYKRILPNWIIPAR